MRSRLKLLSRILDGSSKDVVRDFEPVFETFPLSPPLPVSELPSRRTPTCTFDNHWKGDIRAERPLGGGPRLMTLDAIAGIGLERGVP